MNIDPDIQALRSFSMARKVIMQRERDRKAMLEIERMQREAFAASLEGQFSWDRTVRSVQSRANWWELPH